MDKKICSAVMLTVLSTCMVALAFNVPPAKTELATTDSLDPMINPEPGQYANYSLSFYDENEALPRVGWWNFSYIDYLTFDLINTTHTSTYPDPFTLWMAINVTNRWIPYGNHWWVHSWYVPWIETSIAVGSVINMWRTDGTVVGTTSRTIELNGQETSIDCWKVRFSEPGHPSMNYTVFYDKQSGVTIEHILSREPDMILTLVTTNIPIGQAFPSTIDELKTKIDELGLQGEIDNHGIVKSLLAKLNAAQKLVDKGKMDEAKRILEEDFIPQVENLTDIHLTPEAAGILIQSAEYILSNL